MEMKIFHLLLLLYMQICFSNIMASPFHGSSVLRQSSTAHTKIPRQPYPKNLPVHGSSHFGKKRNGHKKVISHSLPRKKSFRRKWTLTTAADPYPRSIALPPSISPSRGPAKKWAHGPESSTPYISYHKHHHYHYHHHHQQQQGPALSPSYQPPFISSRIWSPPASAPAPSPSPATHHTMPIISPSVSPRGSVHELKEGSPPTPILALPPPPPNTDCSSVTCAEPLTYTPTGAPCGCVLPIQVKLNLNMPIYGFFPLVSRLAKAIADGVALNRSQVRIMGADAASNQQEKTAILVNLVPRGLRFDYVTAFHIFDKFWRRQVVIDDSVFGDYEVLYVHYPGLPPSPPPAPLGISVEDGGPFGAQTDHGLPMKPLGVDVSKTRNDGRLGKRTIGLIVASCFTAFVVILGVSWLLLMRFRSRSETRAKDFPQPLISPQAPIPVPKQPTGSARPTPLESIRGSRESLSLGSGTMTYAGSAKIFTLGEIERATNNLDPSRVLGEGGFGLVYSGTLDDSRQVAVKILKRDDHHGGREFLAEVEMLSRLHHRNLVKLIGICTEGQARCLVYELVPNGSVESHLHGVDKEIDPLDWDARMKIALGAARGLAYLHEDSNPRVIHRDFKSSNILLDHDFTPKVSDFGLARAALDGNKHISTHVMGTFGYLAPEYAMTGHLLVKSDVYSYGVVLLELLTGRKPVDLTQPPGQENLVAWVRPLLTNKEALETLIDPSLNLDYESSLDSVAKVAAIASMCVQPEVNHRPFMGEVVQALKLVCNEFDETIGLGSRVGSQDDFLGTRSSTNNTRVSGDFARVEIASASQSHDYVSCSSNNNNDGNKNNNDSALLSTTELMSAPPMGIEPQDFGSFRRFSSSGPLASGRTRRFWKRFRSLSWGNGGEQHGFPNFKIWSTSR